MMTTGTLFPTVTAQQVHAISIPVMLMGGTESYPFLITETLILKSLLPAAPVLWVRGAGHQMWLQQPDLCRDAVEDFIGKLH
jgi:pimeloyl-ACP methyl ester carboxylesterase